MTKDASKDQPPELVWLLGQPHLSDYLDFVATKVIGGESQDARELSSQWRAANDVYAELEVKEAGLAEKAECLPIEAEVEPLAAAVAATPWFRQSFDNLPFEFVRVELDKLIVSQTHVESSFLPALAARLGDKPDATRLFNFCLPVERQSPPVRVQRLSANRYVFSCYSTDFRSHQTRLFAPGEFQGDLLGGPCIGLVGVGVGFGSNFLSAVRSGSRILLQNGYHRAYALRRLGFTHAYCVVEDVTRKDELKLTADDDVAADPEFYFAAKRPPLLKDFFDPRLTVTLPVKRMENQVEVEIKVRSSIATDFGGA